VDKREKVGIVHKHLANENVGSLFSGIVINMEPVPCMSTFNPRLFTNHDRLKSIAPTHLISLFKPWADYLANRGIVLPDSGDVEFPFEALSRVLMMPTDATPPGMIDALYFIDENTSDSTIDDLIEIAREHRLNIDSHAKVTVADVAVQIWIAKSDVLKARHSRSVAFNQKSFTYFAGKANQPRGLTIPDSTRIEQIQNKLDEWFAEHGRGQASRIFFFPRESRVWIMIRHGMAMRREGSHQDDGESGIHCYRPQKHDVLVYDEALDEIGVHADTKGEIKVYREVLGLILFGRADYFAENSKFTLDPLIEHGPQALACDDIEGIDRIVLVELRRFWGGPFQKRETVAASDLFGDFGEEWQNRLRFGRLTSASFRFYFSGSSKGRLVKIRLPGTAGYDRDDDSALVEKWLAARGFLRKLEAELEHAA
jgi:hypothetical protein